LLLLVYFETKRTALWVPGRPNSCKCKNQYRLLRDFNRRLHEERVEKDTLAVKFYDMIFWDKKQVSLRTYFGMLHKTDVLLNPNS
jgi:hypothetical protein